ncbi:scavenger receptor class F member 1-like [Haliotis rubra]|uniref:scavenger receptor class F member 1-like n=1 Tax=Haliotis rubra TaxID=36100 RepID=UPI001EE527A8|nr:scavenger receptor class F member 1-like [Haliotis rubra]
MTGSGKECDREYFGPNCGYSCDHCLGSCEHGCTRGCLPGLYGTFCDKTCSDKCGPDPNISTDKPLLAPNTGVRDCHRDSGDCIHGCDEGWYGRQCSSLCSSNCRNSKCQSDTGSCTDGCARGFYGERCHLTCNVCLGGVCDQKTGVCSKGCHLTGRRCDSTCTSNCSMEECQRLEQCNHEALRRIQIVTLATSILFGVVGAILVAVMCCRRRVGMARMQRESPHDGEPGCPNDGELDYQQETKMDTLDTCQMSDKIYHEINVKDMGPEIVFL